MDAQFRVLGNIWNGLRDIYRLPTTYCVADIETTGFNPKVDLIVEVGWAIVQDCQLLDYAGMILNWTAFRPDDHEFQSWLRRRLEYTAESFAKDGRKYHFTYERLRDEGVPPLQGLHDFANILRTFMDSGAWLVGHGIRKFDRPRINGATLEFLDYELPWHQSPICDTGLIEKAAQIGRIPLQTETLEEWYSKVDGRFVSVKWNLSDHCAVKYNLAERFHLDTSLVHTAGFDCLLNYALAETYRQIGEACRGLEQD